MKLIEIINFFNDNPDSKLTFYSHCGKFLTRMENGKMVLQNRRGSTLLEEVMHLDFNSYWLVRGRTPFPLAFHFAKERGQLLEAFDVKNNQVVFDTAKTVHEWMHIFNDMTGKEILHYILNYQWAAVDSNWEVD